VQPPATRRVVQMVHHPGQNPRLSPITIAAGIVGFACPEASFSRRPPPA
jgi:hypothetical protein